MNIHDLLCKPTPSPPLSLYMYCNDTNNILVNMVPNISPKPMKSPARP